MPREVARSPGSSHPGGRTQAPGSLLLGLSFATQPDPHYKNLSFCACLGLMGSSLERRGQGKRQSASGVLDPGNRLFSALPVRMWKAFRASLMEERGNVGEATDGTNSSGEQSPRMQAGALMLGPVPGLGGCVKGAEAGIGAGRERILREAATYKLFPKTLLFEAPRCCISSGSDCSSPTIVGPTSCKVRHSGCLAGCQEEVEGFASPSSPAC